MLISRHLIYIDAPTGCWRQELLYDPPLEIDLSLGMVSSILNSQMAPKGTTKGSLRKCKPIINANDILHINEVMKAGETVSIVLRSGYRLRDIVLRDTHQLLVLVDDKGLHYWFTIGQDGVFEVTGTMLKDNEGMHSRLKANLRDIPYRAYVVQRSLASVNQISDALDKPKDVMSTNEAAKYLGISASTLYKIAGSGKVPRTPQKKFLRADLDAYLASTKKPVARRDKKH
jgi:excisionase family DNA binding protein